jgi:hypothetical protein
MLVHFYAFLFFEDWREDLWMKRYVRACALLALRVRVVGTDR